MLAAAEKLALIANDRAPTDNRRAEIEQGTLRLDVKFRLSGTVQVQHESEIDARIAELSRIAEFMPLSTD